MVTAATHAYNYIDIDAIQEINEEDATEKGERTENDEMKQARNSNSWKCKEMLSHLKGCNEERCNEEAKDSVHRSNRGILHVLQWTRFHRCQTRLGDISSLDVLSWLKFCPTLNVCFAINAQNLWLCFFCMLDSSASSVKDKQMPSVFRCVGFSPYLKVNLCFCHWHQ